MRRIYKRGKKRDRAPRRAFLLLIDPLARAREPGGERERESARARTGEKRETSCAVAVTYDGRPLDDSLALALPPFIFSANVVRALDTKCAYLVRYEHSFIYLSCTAICCFSERASIVLFFNYFFTTDFNLGNS